MEQLARIYSALPLFLLGPGVVGSGRLRNVLRREPQVQDVVSFYDRLSILVVGIGVLSRQHVFRESGYVSNEDEVELEAKGAVGDVALNFSGAAGQPAQSSLNERVLGIGLEQLRRAPRVLECWIDSLITDLATAQRLLADP
jgi:DNA-binding transcriptional regulator LsrR (DeoR family)